MTLPPHALHALKVRLKSVSNKGHFAHEDERVFIRICPRIAVVWLKYATSHSLHMRYKHCKLCWSRSVMKGTLLFRPKIFSSVSPLALHWGDWNIPHVTPCACKVGWSRSVMNCTFQLRPKEFFVCISPPIAVGWLQYGTCHSLRMRYVQCKLGLNR
jgi:hypothetical protein